jgi:hypothetical protein
LIHVTVYERVDASSIPDEVELLRASGVVVSSGELGGVPLELPWEPNVSPQSVSIRRCERIGAREADTKRTSVR